MMDWNVVVATCGAVAIGAFKLVGYWIRVRAIMRATPEQLAALDKVEPPAFIRTMGPALALLALAGALAGWPHLARLDSVARLPRGDFHADLRPHGLPAKEPAHVQD